MKEAVRQRARELGFDQCRFTTAEPPRSAEFFSHWLASGYHGEMAYLQRNAAKRVDPQHVLAGARTIISLAVNYARKSETRPDPRLGVVAAYARFEDYHDVLRPRLEQLAQFVSEAGGQGTRSLWYVDTGPLLERDLAQRAGIGFVGKHTNLVSRELGNFFLLCEIITTFAAEPDPEEKNRCGSCSRCITACPTGAIKSPFQLDARLCISYLTIELKGSIPEELRPALGNRIFGCDDCLAACPWNRFAREAHTMNEVVRPELAGLDLVGLLSLDEEAFRTRFARTPILRARRRGLQRNVCVALGNCGDGTALPALNRAANDSDALIAEHAAWALAQIRKRSIRS